MYSRQTNVDMWRNGNFETNPPWYVAHVWPINVCLCGRRGNPRRTTSGYVFPGALWLLPLLSVVREWDSSSPATLHPLLAAPTDWYLDPPAVRTFSHVAADGGKTGSFFFFFLLAPTHILRTATGFSILVVSVERGSQKMMRRFQNTKYNCFEEQGRKKKPCNRPVQVSSESQQSRCNLPSWRGWLASYLAFNQCFCIIKLVPSS